MATLPEQEGGHREAVKRRAAVREIVRRQTVDDQALIRKAFAHPVAQTAAVALCPSML